jgi:hypothetical protein
MDRANKIITETDEEAMNKVFRVEGRGTMDRVRRDHHRGV